MCFCTPEKRTPCCKSGACHKALREKTGTTVCPWCERAQTEPTSTAPVHSEQTVSEEWREIVICMGMLIDRVDRLVERAGCKSRRELMLRLGAKGGA